MASVPDPSRRYAKVPVVMQMEKLESGAASLAMVLGYYHRWVALEQLRQDCGVSRDGISVTKVTEAARMYGLNAEEKKIGYEQIIKEGTYPCIIRWNRSDMAVLCGFKGGIAYINDPAKGVIKVSRENFEHSYQGVCLFFSPSENFEPGGRRIGTLEYINNYRKKSGAAALIFALLTMFVLFYEALNPLFSKIYVDMFLTRKYEAFFGFFMQILIIITVVQVVLNIAQAFYSVRLSAKLDVEGSSAYMWKVFRLPLQFFTQRSAGDILQRQKKTSVVVFTLIQELIPLFFNILMMLFYLFVMIRYSVIITMVGVFVVIVNLVLSRMISKKRVNILRIQLRDKSKLTSCTASGMQMIETLKASSSENGFFEKWANLEASVNNQFVKYDDILNFMGIIPSLLRSVSYASVLIIGAWLTIDGKFTIGMIMSFQGLLSAFMGPAAKLTEIGETVQEMRADMERIDDVMEYDIDPSYSDEPMDDNGDYSKLKGEVELKNVSFGYSRLSDPIVDDISIRIGKGRSVAIVGGSGCGKSTVSKLISGLYTPWSGEILFDGKPMNEIDRRVFKGSLAVVDQDIILFEDTVANNICMWNRAVAEYEMILACRDAQIYDDIMSREGGFEALIKEGGTNLSGGQRQRLEIARVLTQDPSILIMDEATSALDSKTEHNLVKAVKERGITCIVIAHRLSTIRDCDEIIVLDKGRIVERGTHDELYAKGGYYSTLITSE